jgi:hypothetical protein
MQAPHAVHKKKISLACFFLARKALNLAPADSFNKTA